MTRFVEEREVARLRAAKRKVFRRACMPLCANALIGTLAIRALCSRGTRRSGGTFAGSARATRLLCGTWKETPPWANGFAA